MEYFIFFMFYGKKFYPGKLEDYLGIKFDYKKINEYTRNGEKIKYGDATLICYDYYQPSFKFLDKIEEIKKVSEKFGIEEITLCIDIKYSSQCNLSYEPKLLRKLGDLGIDFRLKTIFDPNVESD